MSVVSGSLSVVCPVPVRFLVRSLSVGCPVPSLSFVRRSPLIPDMKEPPPSGFLCKFVTFKAMPRKKGRSNRKNSKERVGDLIETQIFSLRPHPAKRPPSNVFELDRFPL